MWTTFEKPNRGPSRVHIQQSLEAWHCQKTITRLNQNLVHNPSPSNCKNKRNSSLIPDPLCTWLDKTKSCQWILVVHTQTNNFKPWNTQNDQVTLRLTLLKNWHFFTRGKRDRRSCWTMMTLSLVQTLQHSHTHTTVQELLSNHFTRSPWRNSKHPFTLKSPRPS